MTLHRIRTELAAAAWVPVFFGVTYAVSQLAIIAILRPVGTANFLHLQCLTFDAASYIEVFTRWRADGSLDAYRAHLTIDTVHWVWYSMFATSLLARLFERLDVPPRYDFVLLLPLASGLFDGLENHFQHVFLETPDFAAIVDPLPLWSACASILKWLLVAIYVTTIGALGVRSAIRRRRR